MSTPLWEEPADDRPDYDAEENAEQAHWEWIYEVRKDHGHYVT